MCIFSTLSTIEGTLPVSNGGTGRTTLTDGAVLVGDGVNPVELVGPLTDGQLLIGDTAGVSPTLAQLTAGSNITIVNAAGSITISSTGGLVSPVGISDGGTGQTAQTAAFDALSPTTTKGDVVVNNGSDNIRLAIGADTEVLTADSGEASGVKWAAGGSSGFSIKEYWFASESLQPLETNFAPIEKLAGTNVNVFVRAFDDTTEEYSNGKLQVPGDVDTSGTVTFRSYVTAKTAAGAKNIGLTFGHLAINNSEDWDPAGPYTEEDSGATAIDATQDDVTEVTWTETIANLGWTANDLVIFRISRDTGVADDLTGDMYMFSLAIEIPRA